MEVTEQGFEISKTGLFALLIFFLLIMCSLNMAINHKLTFVALKLLRFALYRNGNNLNTVLIKTLSVSKKVKDKNCHGKVPI